MNGFAEAKTVRTVARGGSQVPVRIQRTCRIVAWRFVRNERDVVEDEIRVRARRRVAAASMPTRQKIPVIGVLFNG